MKLIPALIISLPLAALPARGQEARPAGSAGRGS